MKRLNRREKDRITYTAIMMTKLEDFLEEHNQYNPALAKYCRLAVNATKGYLRHLKADYSYDQLEQLAMEIGRKRLIIGYPNELEEQARVYRYNRLLSVDAIEHLCGHSIEGFCKKCNLDPLGQRLCDLRPALNECEVACSIDDTEDGGCPYRGLKSQPVTEEWVPPAMSLLKAEIKLLEEKVAEATKTRDAAMLNEIRVQLALKRRLLDTISPRH